MSEKDSSAILERRTFIAGFAAATATLAGMSLVGCNDNKLDEVPPEVEGPTVPPGEEGATWYSTPCWHNCGGRCVNKVLIKDGVVLRQKTDDSHEDSYGWPQARGCIRGRATQQQVFGADRLKYPMKRKHWEPLTGGDKSLRGRDEWERISWDEALDYIAAELKNAKEKYGNRSIFFMNIINLEGYWGGLLSAFGGYVDSSATQSTGTFAYNTRAFGWQEKGVNDRMDLENSDYIVLWGHNAAWCAFGNPSYYLKHAKEAGSKFLFVGPEYSVTAGFVDAEWIPVRPASDTALICGLAHSMITRDRDGSLIDWDYLNRCTVGFDAEHMPTDAKSDENYRDYILGTYDGVEKTAEWASELCGTPVETIHHLADILGCKNAVSIHSNGAAARNNGAENYPQALMTLGAMGGHYGKPGHACGNDQYYSAMNNGRTLTCIGQSGHPFQFTTANNPLDDSLNCNEMWRSILEGKYIRTGNMYAGQYDEPEERALDIHVIVSEQHNLLQSQPNINEGIEAFRKVDFVCSQAYTMKTDTKYSDIVLPICTRWEVLRDNWYATQADRENSFTHRKILDPLFESRSDYDVAKELAGRLGLDFSTIVPMDEKQLWFNALQGGFVTNEDGSTSPLCTITQEDLDRYEVEGSPQEGAVGLEKFLEDGVYRVQRSSDDAFVDISFKAFREDPEKNPLDSASGKMEIYCQAKGDLFARINGNREGYVTVSPLPKYLEQHEGYKDSFIDWENRVPGPYPFQMTHAHYLRRAHTDYDNLPWLREAMVNPVFINKDDAEAKGVANGDVILVHNDRGKFIRPASVSRCIMPGVIVVPHGAGASIDEETGIDKAGADNILTSSSSATSTQLNGWNTTLVEYEKYTGDIDLLPDCDWPLDVPIAE